MNWLMIFVLSLFGLGMGLATIAAVPSNLEPFCWLVIFIICAGVIALDERNRPFQHGLMLGIANSVWITATHLLFFDTYVAGHAQEAAMTASLPLANHPRLWMGIIGPVIGLASGVVLGLFAIIARKLRRRSLSK